MEPELAPLLPELFADLEDLGVRAVDVVALLQPLQLPAEARVLDLGCGKGAATFALAQELGVHTEGVDGLPAFVEHATRRAKEAGLSERCRYREADLRREVERARDYDVVMLLALGDVLGDQTQTVRALSACVRPGGYIVVDDAFIADGAEVDLNDLVGCYPHQETLERLQRGGAQVIAEQEHAGKEMMAWLKAAAGCVVERARDLSEAHPELEDALFEFAKRQWEETALLEGPVVGATWLLQKPL